MVNSMGITGYDYVEFYVGSAKMAAYWYIKALRMWSSLLLTFVRIRRLILNIEPH